MERLVEPKSSVFVDRRGPDVARQPEVLERRQFCDSQDSMKPEVNELAEAVDQYKLRHRRRFITFEELHDVIVDLSYSK